MKFLLVIKERANRPHEPEPGKFNRVIRDHVSRLLEDGTLDCAYYVLPRGGMGIVNAESHEALLRVIKAWPGEYQHDFEVHALCDLFQAIDDNYAARGGGPAGTR